MGLMRFIVSPPGCLTEDQIQQAYLAGMDRIPWKVQARQEGGQLILQRSASDSASLHIPWDVPGQGRLVISTGSLVERLEPYHLPLELARGKIGQLRNQLADWQGIGLMVPAAIPAKIAAALQWFGQAVVCAGDRLEESATLAAQALSCAVEAAALLAACYTEQAIAARRRVNGRIPTHLAATLGASLLDENMAPLFLQTFNAAIVPMNWREVETAEGRYGWDVCDRQFDWCRQYGLTVYGGPLLQLDRHTIPDWLYVCEGDFDDIVTFASEFMQHAVSRYRGKVDIWQCAARMHTTDLLSLSEEDCLRMTARAIEVVRTLDGETPVVVSFDQPWGEYLSRRGMDFPPLQFADALVRAGLGLAGLVLEINLGYYPGGTLPRDPVDISRQLDYWASLGLPLHISLNIPSGAHEDPLALRRVKLPSAQWSAQDQQAWIGRLLPMLLAKPYVQGILWNQLRDSEPHEFPHGGLFDVRRQPKPGLHALHWFRQAYLK
jgi:hypothetical protein